MLRRIILTQDNSVEYRCIRHGVPLRIDYTRGQVESMTQKVNRVCNEEGPPSLLPYSCFYPVYGAASAPTITTTR